MRSMLSNFSARVSGATGALAHSTALLQYRVAESVVKGVSVHCAAEECDDQPRRRGGVRTAGWPGYSLDCSLTTCATCGPDGV